MGFRLPVLPADIRAQLYPIAPVALPADPLAREEAWIASGTGETFHEFVVGLLQRERDCAAQVALQEQTRRPQPDPGIYPWR